ncbi:hypothetical protein BC937DRAFT_93492 [Endogone sp. FLAS-F59071]|nr:hypothetical protein BC937DRAFT_93492 [Endogone sp. FLAS-F59071]|eukprot:RUS14670.1 hypothetical protein BC937DRAFT_93492 [Endogone sp. FLAS-F59071]
MTTILDTFRSWLVENNSTIDKLTIDSVPNAGYGLFTSTEPILLEGPSAPLALIPPTLLISAPRILQYAQDHEPQLLRCLELLRREGVDTTTKLTERMTILIFLVYERHHRATTDPPSFWKPYIDILPGPTSLSTVPILYPPKLFNLISDTRIHDSVLAKRAKLKRELDWITPHAIAAGWEQEIDIDAWTWADTVFWSRVVGVGSQFVQEEEQRQKAEQPDYYLVPFVDFANHSPDPTIRWHLREDGSGVELLPVISLTSSSPALPANTELRISYGVKPNQELLFLHGFCVPNNPILPTLVIPAVPFFDAAEAFDRRKIAWLRRRGSSMILTLNPPVRDQDVDWSAGFTPESILIMLLVVLSQDPKGHMVLIKDDDDEPQLLLAGTTIDIDTPLPAIMDAVCGLPNYDVVRLHVVTLLLDALQWFWMRLTGTGEEGEENVSFEARVAGLLGDAEEEELVRRVVDDLRIYRQEEEEMIGEAIRRLEKTSEELMKSEVVKAYLEAAQQECEQSGLALN